MMTLKGGASQACAVCKYQRRRCTKDCLLAPYFPADQPKVFQNAHRLFGVSNIMKILREVHPDKREEAMKSIKYESFIRARFPVHGCSQVIRQLSYQLHHGMEELKHVRARLAEIKEQHVGDPSETSDFTVNNFPANHYLEDNTLPILGNDFFVQAQSQAQAQAQAKQYRYDNHFYSNGNTVIRLPQGFLQDYDDDTQSYMESKEACQASMKTRKKDKLIMENLARMKLKDIDEDMHMFEESYPDLARGKS